MRGIAAAVLVFEAVVIVLAIPVAVEVADVDASVAWPAGLAVAGLCVVTAGLLGRPWGYHVGWAMQGAVLSLGFVVPAMFLLGAVFGFLWYVALRLGRQVEEQQRRRGEADPSS